MAAPGHAREKKWHCQRCKEFIQVYLILCANFPKLLAEESWFSAKSCQMTYSWFTGLCHSSYSFQLKVWWSHREKKNQQILLLSAVCNMEIRWWAMEKGLPFPNSPASFRHSSTESKLQWQGTNYRAPITERNKCHLQALWTEQKDWISWKMPPSRKSKSQVEMSKQDFDTSYRN